jgi:hypothetical protein
MSGTGATVTSRPVPDLAGNKLPSRRLPGDYRNGLAALLGWKLDWSGVAALSSYASILGDIFILWGLQFSP